MIEGVAVIVTIPVEVSALMTLPLSAPTMFLSVALMSFQTSNDDVVVADCADSLVAPPPSPPPPPPLADSPPESSVNERSEEHTSELQSLMRISYAVFCLKKKKYKNTSRQQQHN